MLNANKDTSSKQTLDVALQALIHPEHSLSSPSQPGFQPLHSSGWLLIHHVSGGGVCAERSLAVVTMTTTFSGTG